jgi:hypothetical protein
LFYFYIKNFMRKRKHNMIAALSWSTAAHDYLNSKNNFLLALTFSGTRLSNTDCYTNKMS